jgi:hypothetical protein
LIGDCNILPMMAALTLNSGRPPSNAMPRAEACRKSL